MYMSPANTLRQKLRVKKLGCNIQGDVTGRRKACFRKLNNTRKCAFSSDYSDTNKLCGEDMFTQQCAFCDVSRFYKHRNITTSCRILTQ